jgi:enoyl-CoA hydratase
MSDSTVLYDVTNGVATITLNRPEARNALSSALIRELVEAFDRANSDEEVRVVILTGAGEAFCAGVDLKEFGKLDGAPAPDPKRPDCWQAMARCERPIIGAINGPAVTGGFEIALACDVLIASSRARFADTHARVGVIPGAGLSQRLSRAIGIYRAKYLSLTGNFMPAQQAAEWGLVSHVVAPEDLMATANKIAEDMLSIVPHMLFPMKKLIDDGFASTFAEGMSLEDRVSKEYMKEHRPQKAARAAFKGVRERGRSQNE